MKSNYFRSTLLEKSTAEHLFWCFMLSQIEESSQYLEGSTSTWKDHDRTIGVNTYIRLVVQYLHKMALDTDSVMLPDTSQLLPHLLLIYCCMLPGPFQYFSHDLCPGLM